MQYRGRGCQQGMKKASLEVATKNIS